MTALETPPEETFARSPIRLKTVLVVDDDVLFRALVISILSSAGYKVDEAADGSEAIARVAKQHFDVMITDLVMPNREGLETIQYFSQHFPQVPIVAVSGKASYLRSASVLGAVATVEKTGVVAHLLGTIRRTMGE
jgi:CheY-like chemotaxis protein